MKQTILRLLALLLPLSLCLSVSGCGDGGHDYTIGICQLMVHDSLDQATQGFIDALTEEMNAAGKTVTFDTQVAGGEDLCATVINTFTAKKVDLIMANATPALLAAANATSTIPILGTSVTDYGDTFANQIPANVSGTSDAVPFAEQAEMMIDTLHLTVNDQVGILYCTNESNSLLQYEAVRALFADSGIAVKAYTFSETTQLQSIVTAMAKECAAVYIPSDNTVAANDTVVGTICTQQNVPVYTSYDSTICYASLAINYYDLGVETGKMAAQILLHGATVSDLEITTLAPTAKYHNDLCLQLGIPVPTTTDN